jgi:hypothetical protein
VTLQLEYPIRFSFRRMKKEAIGCTPGRINGKWLPGRKLIARQVAPREYFTGLLLLSVL